MADPHEQQKNKGPEYLPDGREKLRIYEGVQRSLEKGIVKDVFPKGSESLDERFEKAYVDFYDIAYEWRYVKDCREAFNAGVQSYDTFYKFAENLKPLGKGGWEDLTHDLVCFFDPEYQLCLDDIDSAYEEKIAELKKQRESLQLNPDKALKVVGGILEGLYKSGQDFVSLMGAGYQIAQVLYGPQEGASYFTRLIAEMSDKWGKHSSEDRMSLRIVYQKVGNNRDDKLYELAIFAEAKLNRGEKIDWKIVSELLEEYTKNKEKYDSYGNEIGENITKLTKKYEPPKKERGIKQAWKWLSERFKKKNGKEKKDDIKEEELDFLEKLVRFSVGADTLRKILAHSFIGASVPLWTGGSAVFALGDAGMRTFGILSNQICRNLWNAGVSGWGIARQAGYDRWSDKKYEEIWEGQLYSALTIRKSAEELVRELALGNYAEGTVLKRKKRVFIGPNLGNPLKGQRVSSVLAQDIIINVVSPSSAGEPYRVIVYREGEGDKNKIMTFELEQGDPAQFVIEKRNLRGHDWFDKSSFMSSGVGALWSEVNFRSSVSTVSGNGRIDHNESASEVAINKVLHRLGMKVATKSMNLFIDGLGFLLPSARVATQLDDEQIKIINDEILSKSDQLIRGWNFFCMFCAEVEATAYRCKYENGYPPGDKVIVWQFVQSGSNGHRLCEIYTEINRIFLSPRNLKVSDRIELLTLIKEMGSLVDNGSYFGQGIRKQQFDFPSLFAEGKRFYGVKPGVIAQDLYEEAEQLRSSWVNLITPDQALRKLMHIPRH